MWIYNQLTGQLSQDSNPVEIGYSGGYDIPADKNNPAAQAVRGEGPIPCGMWDIGEPFDSPDHGPYCLTLTPQQGTDTLGRDGFLMHGDSRDHPGQASKGCIIMSRLTRQRVWKSGDHVLKVVNGLPEPVKENINEPSTPPVPSSPGIIGTLRGYFAKRSTN